MDGDVTQSPLTAFAVPLVGQVNRARFDGCSDGERLDRRSWLEWIGDDAVADAALSSPRRIVGIYRWNRCHRQNFAVAWINGDGNTGLGARSVHAVFKRAQPGVLHPCGYVGLANVQQVTLATVAPGIAEALVATAIGLFAAIPAVVAYNRFARDIDRIAITLETFIEEFSNILQRNAGQTVMQTTTMGPGAR